MASRSWIRDGRQTAIPPSARLADESIRNTHPTRLANSWGLAWVFRGFARKIQASAAREMARRVRGLAKLGSLVKKRFEGGDSPRRVLLSEFAELGHETAVVELAA